MLYLSTLRRWWNNRNRDLYVYWDGSRRRRADPLQVGKRLEAVCSEYPQHLDLLAKDANTPPPGPVRNDLIKRQQEAAAALTTAAREVFGLAPLSEDAGVTDGEAFRVLTGYFVLMEGYAAEAGTFR